MARMRRPERSASHRRNDDDEHRHHAIERCAFGQRGELLVGERHGAGEPDANARVGGESRLDHRLANRRDGARTGLQRAEIELRLHENEAAQLARVGRAAHDQCAPRKARHLSRVDRIERIRECGERPGQIVELDLSVAHPFQNERQRVHHPAQGRIGRQRSEQRLRRDHLLRRAGNLFRRCEQQADPIEERTAVGPPQRDDRPGVGETFGQSGGRLLGQFGRRTVDDHGDHGDALWKHPRVVDLPLAPRQIR